VPPRSSLTVVEESAAEEAPIAATAREDAHRLLRQ
jgi:hypothetical protein